MGDVGDGYKAMREATKLQRKENRAVNLMTLRESDLEFMERNNGDTVLFREDGYPRVDFYPGTNKWKVLDKKIHYIRGNAENFIAWYKKRCVK